MLDGLRQGLVRLSPAMVRAATLAFALVLVVAPVVTLSACSRWRRPTTSNGVPLAGPLIPARTTMVTAWDFP